MRRSALLLSVLLGASLGACERDPLFTPVKWVKIPAGSFTMGSPTGELCREAGKFKETQHQVTLTRSFEMSITEVTQGQFESEMGYNPSNYVSCGEDCPVDDLSWYEAAAFCNALSKGQGLSDCYDCTGQGATVNCLEKTAHQGKGLYACLGYRLPTEAEWEYACRAGTTTALYTGPIVYCDSFDSTASSAAWYSSNSGLTMQPSAQKQANAWGLFDMPGSAWEWTNDWYITDLGSAAVSDPSTSTSTGFRIMRGGSIETAAKLVRSASRWNTAQPAEQLKTHGFRCVRTLTQ